MKILYVEPYYSGSHKQWIDSYKKNSRYKIEILGLPGRKWKWRMHGGAVTLAQEYNKLNKNFDLIICSDMLNLPVFKSLTNLQKNNTKVVMFFHENQFSYPWSPNDPDRKFNRDLHYGYINYTSSLVSDHNFFNSYYHRNQYIKDLKTYLNKMPDYNNKNTIKLIEDKSSTLYIGCDLKNNFKLKKSKHFKPIILWNHRWEYDKNPELFFNTLFKLNEKNIDFNLIVLGESFTNYPSIFDVAKEKLSSKIIHFGYAETREKYLDLLSLSNILPVTSNQDFFGISIIEAISACNYPLLPNKLTYPELINNKIFFYNNDGQYFDRLLEIMNNFKDYDAEVEKLSKHIIKEYDWESISRIYDQTFLELFN